LKWFGVCCANLKRRGGLSVPPLVLFIITCIVQLCMSMGCLRSEERAARGLRICGLNFREFLGVHHFIFGVLLVVVAGN